MHRDPEHAALVHVIQELGLDPRDKPSPRVAAVSSFISFSIGALIPLIPYLLGFDSLVAALVVGALGLLVAGGPGLLDDRDAVVAQRAASARLRGASPPAPPISWVWRWASASSGNDARNSSGSHVPTDLEGSCMSTPTFRPKYVSFDCYGTLISWPMTPITKELVGDQIPAEQWDQFVAEFRGYRYDQVLR